MPITIELPAGIEASLRDNFADLEPTTHEAALVEFYCQFKITRGSLQQALGIGRIEIEGILKAHGVTDDLITSEEYEATLKKLAAAG